MNFNLTGTTGTSTTRHQLSAWKIHDVKLEFVGYEVLENKKDPSLPWQTLKVVWGNDEGVFTERIFAPKEGDDVRLNKDGREYPASLERFKFFLAHCGEKMAEPSDYNSFQGKPFTLPKDFKVLAETFGLVLAKPIKKKTIFKLKLVGNNKGESTLPYFVNIGKDGNAYFSNNFIGESAMFSAYELKKEAELKNAKPTDMKSSVTSSLIDDSLTEPAGNAADKIDLDF